MASFAANRDGEAMILLETAQRLYDLGICVIPTHHRIPKRPFTSWEKYQEQRSTADEILKWFSGNKFDGLGVVAGAISGNLEMVEFEGRAIDEGALTTLMDYANDNDLGDLINRLLHGYFESTPSGGIHILYWLSDGEVYRSTEIAKDENNKILAESRGEGGFVVIAPSGGRTHPSGKSWSLDPACSGIPATITADERDRLWSLLALFDRRPVAEPYVSTNRAHDPADGLRPGDDFNNKASWDDILTPHGWRAAFKMRQGYAWTRPGKSRGLSATTGYSNDGVDRLFVFSTSTNFTALVPYTKFAAYTLLEHGGDYSKAASQLRLEGYGELEPTWETFEQAKQAINTEQVGSEPDQVEQHPKLVVLTRSELATLPQPSPLITNTIDQNTLTLLAGHYGTFKSFVALDWCACVATGKPWLGRDVEPGRVVYLAGEGAFGLHERLHSWERAWKQSIPDDMFSVIPRSLKLHKASDQLLLGSVVQEIQPKLLVIDTLSRASVGLEENSATDMGILTDSALRLVQSVPGMAVVLVHHTGKDKKTVRGSSVLEDNVDAVYISEGDEAGVNLTRTKRKDGVTHDLMRLKFEAVAGTASGIMITGSIAVDTSRRVELLLSTFLSTFHVTGASRKELESCVGMPRTTLNRAINDALREGLIVNTGSDSRPHYHLTEEAKTNAI